MTSENNNERISRAAERSTPPLPPEVRKRALWAVMAAMQRRSPLRMAILAVVLLLLLAAAVYIVVRWLSPEGDWFRRFPGRAPIRPRDVLLVAIAESATSSLLGSHAHDRASDLLGPPACCRPPRVVGAVCPRPSNALATPAPGASTGVRNASTRGSHSCRAAARRTAPVLGRRAVILPSAQEARPNPGA